MRILLAEDDEEVAEFISNGLSALDYFVVVALDGIDALKMGLSEEFDLFIFDRMMPGKDGLSVLKELRRANVTSPAILLTALGRIEDRVHGLDAGADDYLVKPFALQELVARINALARRTSPKHEQALLSAGPIEMNLLTREVRRDGHPILLQPKEFRLLEELLRNAGEYVTRTMLLERVWKFHFDPQTKIVETHMSRFRSKLNEGELEDRIETMRGVGYRLMAQ